MTHGSLFSGIGGFDLAARWAGIQNVFNVEIDKFCQKVLEKNFPETEKYLDIKEFNGAKYAGKIDILTGGFPCQPFSQAGKRKGTDDSRHLFPEMLRVISEIRPGWVIGENVYGLLNIENGMVFEQVCTELEILEYEVQTYIIPACGKNAPHKRDRLWIVAKNTRHGDGSREQNGKEFAGQIRQENAIEPERSIGCTTLRTITDTDNRGLERGKRKSNAGLRYSGRKNEAWEQNWTETASEFCRVDDGLPVELDGFKLSKAKHRVERLKSLGNAIVPQIAYEIFKAILLTEKEIAK